MPVENGSDRQANQHVELDQSDDGGTAAQHPSLTTVRYGLLVLVPLGLIAGVLQWAHTVVFFLNFFAIIPLAPSINASATRLAKHVGPVWGSLLRVILGNSVGIIVRSCSTHDLIRFISLTVSSLTLDRHYCCHARTNRGSKIKPHW